MLYEHGEGEVPIKEIVQKLMMGTMFFRVLFTSTCCLGARINARRKSITSLTSSKSDPSHEEATSGVREFFKTFFFSRK